jgi:thymidylate synthase (FAD)
VRVLDHGYVKLIESWGSDERVIESARMSTDGGFRGWGPLDCPDCVRYQVLLDDVGTERDDRERRRLMMKCKKCSSTGYIPGDEKLLAFLYKHKHMTPFEMGGMTIEVQAPIMVFREWHRHRTQSYNEMSGRYIELPDLYYIPSIERLMGGKQSTKNKQSSEEGFDHTQADNIQIQISQCSSHARSVYKHLLQKGLSRELARLVIPVNQYSRMRASANLRNWLGFLTLRMEEGAQFEIREYANAVAELIKEQFPRTYELFESEL